MKKVIFVSLLLVAPLSQTADYQGIDPLVNGEAPNAVYDIVSQPLDKANKYACYILTRYAFQPWLILLIYMSPECTDPNFISPLNEGGFKTFPKRWIQTHGLSLNNNQIQVIPDDLEYINQLRFLSLNNNLITTFPSSRNMPHLQVLQLDGNQIDTIPENLVSEDNYNIATRTENGKHQTTTEPEDLCFTLLTRLFLNNNQIQTIPGDFQLRNLEILSLNNNRIQAIDTHILDQLLQLRELHVEGNHLDENNIKELQDYAEGRENLTIFFGEQKGGLNAKGAKK